MQLTVNGKEYDVAEQFSLEDALHAFSQYGDEATVCLLNGKSHRSVDPLASIVLQEGDMLDIFPLIIGG